MTEKKREILEKSFSLFLRKGYKGVSITDIQKEVGLGRASLYHYFESKEALLKEVFDTIFIELVTKNLIKDCELLSLKDFLKIKNSNTNRILKDFEDRTGKRVGVFNFFLLIFNAIELFPEYTSNYIFDFIQNKEITQWKVVIQNSIENKEVRTDIDVEIIARMFIALEDGIGMTHMIDQINDYEAIICKSQIQLYDLIKL